MCFVFIIRISFLISYRCFDGYCIIFVLHIAVKRFEKSEIVKFSYDCDENASTRGERKGERKRETL